LLTSLSFTYVQNNFTNYPTTAKQYSPIAPTEYEDPIAFESRREAEEELNADHIMSTRTGKHALTQRPHHTSKTSRHHIQEPPPTYLHTLPTTTTANDDTNLVMRNHIDTEGSATKDREPTLLICNKVSTDNIHTCKRIVQHNSGEVAGRERDPEAHCDPLSPPPPQ
jgi:hypothetical protein